MRCSPRSVKEHQRLFRRVSLDLGHTDAMQLPTDERIRNFRNGQDSTIPSSPRFTFSLDATC